MMNKTLTAISSAFLSASLSAAEPAATANLCTLTYANSDQISGKFLKLDGHKLSINSPHFSESSTTFPSTSLLSLHLPSTTPADNPSNKTHIATITLSARIGEPHSRDTIRGEILEISDDLIKLDTDFAGTVSVDRSLVYSITVGSSTTKIYEGPQSLEEWNTLGGNNNLWSFQQNALVSPNGHGLIAKDLKIPNKAVFEFEIESLMTPSFRAYFYADSEKRSRPTNYYELRLNNRRLTMAGQREGRQALGMQAELNKTLHQNEHVSRFTIYMNKKKGLFHVFLDGVYRDTFTDSAPNPDKMGTSVYFQSDYGQSLKFKNIKLSKWSGAAPIPGDQNQSSLLTGEGQNIHLANGDIMRGVLGQIADGAISIKTQLGTFKVPLSGISILSQRPTLDNKQAKMDRNDIRAYFHDDGWIIIDTDRIDATHIYGNSEALGDCKFRLDAFKQLDFNIYNNRLNKLRKKEK